MLRNKSQTSVIEILLIYSRADRTLRSLLANQFEKYNITMMEWLLLGVLSRGSRDDGLSISAVARELDVTLPQVTALMTGLVKKKLVRLRTLKRDRRSRYAVLSAKGEDVLSQSEEAVSSVMWRWPQAVTPGQMTAYFKTLKAIAYARD